MLRNSLTVFSLLIVLSVSGCDSSDSDAESNKPNAASPFPGLNPNLPGNPGQPGQPSTPANPSVTVTKPDGWVEFTNSRFGYKIFTPARPKQEREGIPQIDERFNTYVSFQRDLQISMVVISPQQFEVNTMMTQYFNGQSVAVKALGTVQSRRELQWAGMRAVEFVQEKGNGTTVLRAARRGDQIYRFWIGGNTAEGRPTEAERRAFFESLRFE